MKAKLTNLMPNLYQATLLKKTLESNPLIREDLIDNIASNHVFSTFFPCRRDGGLKAGSNLDLPMP
jgi:hypothetical protein